MTDAQPKVGENDAGPEQKLFNLNRRGAPLIASDVGDVEARLAILWIVVRRDLRSKSVGKESIFHIRTQRLLRW